MNNLYSTISILIMTTVVILMAGCSVNDSANELLRDEIKMWQDSEEWEDAYIIGKITRKEAADSHLKMLVEENPKVNEPSKPGGSKIWLTLRKGESDILIRKEDGSTVESTLASRDDGQIVVVWTEGVILLSHPGQGFARRVIILKE